MSERFKPCPNCDEVDIELDKNMRDFIRCDDCGLYGPSNDPRGEKWNALPRNSDNAIAAHAADLQDEIARLRAGRAVLLADADLTGREILSSTVHSSDEAMLMQAALRIYQIQAETVGTTERKFTESHSMSAYSVAVAISMLDAIRAGKKGGE